jgi:hypothetical protein
MKTEFELEVSSSEAVSFRDSGYKLKIIGREPEEKPYVSLYFGVHQCYVIKDRDLERFAVNILKALKSKRLKK